ncbi:unnamed protein product [Paramecium sonneborni]|uniref:Uncharacterized protein n=1 Tax=Paramecium sonneborni TaxID=65129 RepID=A0A8S1RK81_9CILI|nr:unnamed protein product [Paramecium sonneborni]
MYVSNKIELNHFTIDANIHHPDMLSKVNYINSNILARNPIQKLKTLF